MTRRTLLATLMTLVVVTASCVVDPLASPDNRAEGPGEGSASGSTSTRLEPDASSESEPDSEPDSSPEPDPDPDPEVMVPSGTDSGLEALAEQCSSGDFSACDELFTRSEVGSDLEILASTCGRRIESLGSTCVETLCPLDIFDGTNLEAEGTVSLVTARFDTVDFVTLICSVGDDLYYFGQAKAPPNSSITLGAEEIGGSYVARNPSGQAAGDFVYEIGPDALVVERDGEVLLQQPTLERR